MSSKSSLREAALRKRQSLSLQERTFLSQECCNRLCDFIYKMEKKNSAVIGLYAATKTELDVLPALDRLAQHFITALPIIPERRHPLDFRRYKPSDPLHKGSFGIREPEETTESITPDIMIVPLLAFDRSGHRIGYGAGYYDTTLAHLRQQKPTIAIGIAFAFQEEPALPTTAHDQPLDVIVTEKEIITPRS